MLLCLVFALTCLSTFATVTVTSATGGTSLSADKSAGSSADSYTPLGNIVIRDGTTSDFAVNQTDATLVLSAPANWEFKVGTGSVAFAGSTITGASIAVSGSTITITFNTGATPGSNNSLTISGIQVRAISKATIAAADITRTGGTASLPGISSTTNFGTLSQVAGTFVKLQVLLPGEMAAPGTTAGKTGSPTAIAAGTVVAVTVNAVDENWNKVSSTNTINIAATDVNGTLPANAALSAGTKSFNVTLRTPGNHTITASNVTNTAITANVSSSITVNVGSFSKLQILLPGETAAPGTATGKTGTALSTVAAGTSVTVTVNAVDSEWNIVSTANDVVKITSTDLNATLPANAALVNGSQTFSVSLRAAGARTITAADFSDATKTSATSPSITVNTGAFSRLQIILPGETASAGSATGKTGTATAFSAGTSVQITVNAVDEYWNKIATATDVVSISSSDALGSFPANAALSAGTKNFTVTLKTVGTQTITASDVTNASIAAGASSATVNVGPFTGLQVLLPGEVSAPGTATGKTGTPSSVTAGSPISITVNAVDAAWNIVTSATDIVKITSTDVNATLPANAALQSGSQIFSVILKTAASKTITASDVTDATKTSGTTPSVTVSAGAFSQIQILLPGEVAAAGSSTGKTGTPTARSAGTSFSFTVNAVDAYWNKVTSATDVIKITSTDPNGTSPAAAALVAGTKSFSITLKTTGAQTLTATDQTSGSIPVANSASVAVNVGPFAKLQILLPGETAAPGTSTGKTGSPTSVTAGSPLIVTVNGVDAAWNIVPSAADAIKITSSDANALLPANAALESGTKTFSVTLKTAGSKTITASDVTNTSRTANTSPSVTVSAGNFSGLQVILPGETAAPGSLTGKTGAPTARSAGTAFTVTVNAVDAYFNKVNTVTDLVQISATDGNATLPANAALVAGTKNFSVTLKTTGTHTVTATDVTSGTVPAVTSSTVAVNIGAYAKLQVLLPGETPAPGTATGKTGSPSAQTAGVPFNIIVNAVDAAWNIVNSVTDVVKLTSTDVNAILPANAALSSGTKTFSVTLRTAGSRTVKATDVTDGSKTAGTSTALSLATGSLYALQFILPGETAAPGTTTGKIGNQNPPARGTAFSVIINAVDSCYNRITSITNTVTITSSDGAAVLPAPAALVSGTRTFSGINLKTSGDQTMTATGASLSSAVVVEDNVAPSSATDYFRSVASGNWNNSANWQSSANGVSGWHEATLTPTSAAAAITILEGHAISVSANVSVDQVVVQSGAELVINSGVTLTLADGPGTDLDVYGVLNHAGAITTTGSLVVENGGRYQHAFSTSSGTIPTATWVTGSACEIIGFTSATGTIGNANQNFSTLTWNCPEQNVATGPSLGGTFSVVDFNVISTGSGTAQFGTAGGTVTVSGSYNQSGGKVTLNNSSGTLNFNLAGNFNLTGGTLQRGSGAANVNFSGSSVQYFTNTSSSIIGAIQFVVNSGAAVDFGSYELNASSAGFTLSSGATMYTAHAEGIASSGATGTIKTATRSFSTGASFVYNGSELQEVGSGLPTTLNNLSINNESGVSFPATSVVYTVSGSLNVLAGSVDLGTNSLAAGVGFSNNGSGDIYTQSTATSPLPANVTWTSNVYYNGNSVQTIVPGSYKNLYLTNAGTKTATGGTLTVTGNWTSTDGAVDLLSNNTSVVFNGTTQTLNDATEAGLSFKNLTFSNSGTKTLQTGTYTIANGGVVNVTGSAVLNANGNLYINSDADGFGSIGPLTGSADITGNVNVKIFIAGKNSSTNRGTKAISSPINDVSLSRKTFQQLQDFIIVTGPGNVNNGFDLGGTNAPDAVTLQTYSEPAYSGISIFPAIPDIYQSAIPGKGYLAYFRGDRSNKASKVNAPFSAPEDVIVTYTGPINKGPITISSLTNSHNTTPAYPVKDPYNGYNLVGNPFAAPIYWQTILANSINLEDMFCIVKADGGTISYLNGVMSNAEPSGLDWQYIQPGQAFYVKVKDTENTGSITFTESAKVTGVSPGRLLSAPTKGKNVFNSTVFNTSSNVSSVKHPQLKLSIRDEIGSDQTTIVFKNGASATSEDDAPYFSGGAVTLGSLSSDNRNLAINFAPLPQQGTSIKLYVSATETKEVSFSFNTLPEGYNVTLKDKYLNSSINVGIDVTYSFSIDKSVSATYGGNRFELVVNPAAVLPLSLVNFEARKSSGAVRLSWRTEKEQEAGYFELERSADSSNFISLTRINATNSGSTNTYSYSDANPLNGNNYYRLKIVNANGEHFYSTVKNVDYSIKGSDRNKLKVYPNPVQDELTVEIPFALTAGKASIYSVTGSKIMTFPIVGNSDKIEKDVKSLSSGVYYIELKDLENRSVGRTKFIKQ